MLNAIKLLNIPKASEASLHLDSLYHDSAFVMKTCQRTIVLQTIKPHLNSSSPNNQMPFEYYEGKEAYLFLLETICGLKSKLLGESEIVAQFKEAFSLYIANEARSSVVLRVLEKLFKDAKEIRRDFLLEIGQQSYAGISRKIIQNQNNDHVLILGSGKLAFDVIKQLEKRYTISVSARNKEKILEIQNLFPQISINIVAWDNKLKFNDYPIIVNTIGVEQIIFEEKFFKQRSELHQQPLFIDLGSPSIIQTSQNSHDGVFRLEDVFNIGLDLDEAKTSKINNAKNAILEIVEKRIHTLGHNYPFSWEELQLV